LKFLADVGPYLACCRAGATITRQPDRSEGLIAPVQQYQPPTKRCQANAGDISAGQSRHPRPAHCLAGGGGDGVPQTRGGNFNRIRRRRICHIVFARDLAARLRRGDIEDSSAHHRRSDFQREDVHEATLLNHPKRETAERADRWPRVCERTTRIRHFTQVAHADLPALRRQNFRKNRNKSG
jgi:hypothetical protein